VSRATNDAFVGRMGRMRPVGREFETPAIQFLLQYSPSRSSKIKDYHVI